MTTAMRDVRRRLRDDLDRAPIASPRRSRVSGPSPTRARSSSRSCCSPGSPTRTRRWGRFASSSTTGILGEGTRYEDAIAGLEDVFAEGEPLDVGDGTQASLVELLRAPARNAPTSLAGQLRYIRDHWGRLLGPELDALIGRLDIAIGILAEEEHALHQRFGGPSDGREVHAPSFRGLGDEPERFSVDSAWMPRLVLMAKSTYVWLDQLSRQFSRDIRTLDAMPDEALDTLASWGVTGLWLIGLWERSAASERIKRMRGNVDAVASAYSLDDYRIAEDLGGEGAYANLRDRAWDRGIRLASDMVPNHMGIDSRWVIDHPEWFLSLPRPPYPSYTFTGPGSGAGRARRDRPRGPLLGRQRRRGRLQARRPRQRRGALHLPRQRRDELPVERHRAARLPQPRGPRTGHPDDPRRRAALLRSSASTPRWSSPSGTSSGCGGRSPGRGRAIPSRAEHALSQAEFDARMPIEFWREVVDRVAAEVPDTLLLAEAFWMLEGYFVRTLGMHRVYNSAFMHMLRDEDKGGGYRKLMRDTLEFDPEILKRYVNFMSNPDEKTALEQFGKGDKYFGVATVMATMPGLPMLGHGQVEGFGEKYGMEYRRATLAEQPDPWLLERHEREIFPLLHRRAWFAEVHDFLLYDFHTDGGGVDEHVLAYSNGNGPTRSLVVFHDRFASAAGTIRESAAYARKSASGTKRLVRRSLAEGLGLPDDPVMFVTFRDARTGLSYLRSCLDIHERGLWLSLDAYQGHVFWEFRSCATGCPGSGDGSPSGSEGVAWRRWTRRSSSCSWSPSTRR